MRDYFLRNLGIGEVWKLRTPAPDASVIVESVAIAPSASMLVSQGGDLMLIYRHPADVDEVLKQDAARLSVQLLAALNFNQILNIHSLVMTEETVTQLTAAVRGLRPRAVLVFGALDAHHLLSLDSATVSATLRQGSHFFEDIPVIVTHELVTLLRQPASKRELWLDMCKVKDMFVH